MKHIIFFLTALHTVTVHAQVSVPFNFLPNTPAVSDEVNANFDVLVQAINNLQAQLDATQAQLDAANATIAQLQDNSVLELDDILVLTTDANGFPTAQFDAVNVQVTNGLGATNGDPDIFPTVAGPVNGVGNLIIGYNESGNFSTIICSNGAFDNQTDCENNGFVWARNQKTGSHNLVVGPAHNYTSHGGLLAGSVNSVNREWSTVSGGEVNLASGILSSVSGGTNNTASGFISSVSGGRSNTASGGTSSVSGGWQNTASNSSSSVSAGFGNSAIDELSSVSGGAENTASGEASSVNGGVNNTASGFASNVSGGKENAASGAYSSVSGGESRSATGESDWAAGSLSEDN